MPDSGAMDGREKRALGLIGTDPAAFYNSRVWRAKAKQILRRDRYECQECRRRGKYRRAECVHHKREIKQWPELALVDGNLESSCRRCHNAVHDKHLNIARPEKERFSSPERW